MENNDVRKGFTRAKFNEENSNFLFAEIAIASIAAGVYFQSWYAGGGILIALLIVLAIKPLAILLVVLFSICWGVIGYGIGTTFDSSQAPVVLSIFAFLCSLGANLSALEWTQDVASQHDN